MKSRSVKFALVLILISFIASIGGNAFACFSPFTMNLEKSLLKCEASMPAAAPIADQADKNCKDSLYKEGQIHPVRSTFDAAILKVLPEVSTVSTTSVALFPQDPSLSVRFLKDQSPRLKYSSIPLYTIHRSFLI